MNVLGSYNYTMSRLHTIDTRIKLFVLCWYSISIFFIHNALGLFILGLFTIYCAYIAGIKLSACKNVLKPLVVLTCFIIIVHVSGISAHGAQAPFSFHIAFMDNAIARCTLNFWVFNISLQGFLLGLLYALRLALLVVASLIFTSTSSHVEITYALHYVLSKCLPRGKIYDDVVLITTLALQFIPYTLQEVLTIKKAQQARGAKFESGGVVRRLKAWIPVLIPAIISLFRRSERLATSLEARGYGRCKRTYRIPEKCSARSWLFCVSALACIIMSVALNFVYL